MINYWPDMDMFVESSSPLTIALLCLAKAINYMINAKKIKNILIRMQSHWDILSGTSEAEILKNYANNSRNMTLLYTRFLYTGLSIFMAIPTLQSIVEYVLPGHNQTYPLLFPVDNIINVEKYHTIILVHSYFSTFYFITILIAVDTMFISHVTHGCAIFTVLGNQLRNLSPESIQDVEEFRFDSDDRVHINIMRYIQNHVEALHFAELLESAYSTTFLFQMGINILSLSVTGVQIVMNLDNPDQVMRCLSSGLNQILHLYMNSLPCQRLMDHSTSIREAIYSSKWYNLSLKSRPLLNVILMRAYIPSQITAGKLYVMSMENFGAVLKTSMSYFTVLSSVR
ncbi:odorant receptor 13a-like isoform X2 [Belonocnema kinseyi]|nr:odorant receptor 13a-like isoform X2 [Belonocnema kinseyi]